MDSFENILDFIKDESKGKKLNENDTPEKAGADEYEKPKTTDDIKKQLIEFVGDCDPVDLIKLYNYIFPEAQLNPNEIEIIGLEDDEEPKIENESKLNESKVITAWDIVMTTEGNENISFLQANIDIPNDITERIDDLIKEKYKTNWGDEEEPKPEKNESKTPMTMNNVQNKEQAQQKAIDWQSWAGEQSLSQGELAEWSAYFEKLAKRFGLEDEFKENGII